MKISRWSLSILAGLLIAIVCFSYPRVSIAANAGFVIQVNAYQNSQDAEREVARLKGRGLSAFSGHDPAQGKWYRVFIGAYPTQVEAERQAETLKKQGTISTYLVKKVNGVGLAPTTSASATPAKAQKTDSPKTISKTAYKTKGAKAQAVHPVCSTCEIETEVISPPETVTEPPKPDLPPKEPASQRLDQGFSIHFRSGPTVYPFVDRFSITRVDPTTGAVDRWKPVSTFLVHAALVPTYRFNRFFEIESSLEKPLHDTWNLWFITLDAKVGSLVEDKFFPYFKAGLVWGSFQWVGAPGSFDSNLGLELGTGVDYRLDNIVLGASLLYRNITFNYNRPANVTASKSAIDFSGITFAGSVGYRF